MKQSNKNNCYLFPGKKPAFSNQVEFWLHPNDWLTKKSNDYLKGKPLIFPANPVYLNQIPEIDFSIF